MKRRKVVIMGAAGRDFHNFNVFFRNNPHYQVIAFTASQIPNISRRRYPKELAGKIYPRGIPIHPEEKLPDIIKKGHIDEAVLAYSDLSHQEVMEKASLALSLGADFRLMGAKATMLKTKKPVVAICAVRTGAGKSPLSRKVCRILKKLGYKVAVVRHPMPYGDLRNQVFQRFSSLDDLESQNCTIEEIEEYEPHIREGTIVYSGVDYAKILKEAEKEADIIVWDGGNNDTPFFKPSLLITIADARRPGHEISYYPGEVNLRMADVVIINKAKTAKKKDIQTIISNTKKLNPRAVIIKADMPKKTDKPELVKNKKVLIVGDGPTLTHGGLSFGAATLEAKRLKAKIVDPRPYATGSIREVYEKYPHLSKILPAMGYGKKQLKELEETINKAKCDTVLIGTPIDLGRYLKINKPYARVTYEIREMGKPKIEQILRERFYKTT
ncbi:MAG: cyclic 2,3-diphosphoglycerate synthase [Candidatus Aenigmatarchaeota archaeon]